MNYQKEEEGWTVIQMRHSGKLDFYKSWEEYKHGFGDVSGEHWLGFEKILSIIADRKYMLRIDLLDWDGLWTHAQYESFTISREEDMYRLSVSGYSGDAGDSLTYHNGAKFSTKDRRNDDMDGDCIELCGGAWWFKDCYHSNLNGKYYEGGHYDVATWGDGIVWRHNKNTNLYSMKATVIKIRQNH